MERMEVDQCAGAAGGGGALRRSNSAPMITSVSDGMAVFSPVSSARYRRSSVSINPSCPSQLLPLSPFSLIGYHKKQEEKMEMMLRGGLQRQSASGLVPVPPVSQWQSQQASVVRGFYSGGGVESDGPPKKLFVAGVTDPAHRSSYTVSVSQSAAGSPPAGGASPQSSPLSLSPPPSFVPFTSHQHPGH
ncbi:hypothetical protein EYF80_042331 [Liparis tanakae]|uniref:Protein FAM122A n=1 Tax=Liparis tanakae TaxID=230148 RepID=A0A4Z2G1L9_9TELE|nr:hypothetical protein EYF80_042331 [Liparis tanakae]